MTEELDGSGNFVASFVFGPHIDEPLVMIAPGSRGVPTTYFYLTDGLGTITEVTQGTRGGTGEYYLYDSFGTLLLTYRYAGDGASANPFFFTGRERDGFFRARYYDSGNGRFLSEDDVGNDEGSNLYIYAGDSPITFRDPTGYYKLKGFPPQLEQEMRDAIQAAIDKLGPTCHGCAGANGPKIVHALETATFVYEPDLPYCGLTNKIPLSRKIEVGNLSFDASRCCSLASTLAHEADHYGPNATDKDKPGGAYDMEKKCFDCGTGHPPS